MRALVVLASYLSFIRATSFYGNINLTAEYLTNKCLNISSPKDCLCRKFICVNLFCEDEKGALIDSEDCVPSDEKSKNSKYSNNTLFVKEGTSNFNHLDEKLLAYNQLKNFDLSKTNWKSYNEFEMFDMIVKRNDSAGELVKIDFTCSRFYIATKVEFKSCSIVVAFATVLGILGYIASLVLIRKFMENRSKLLICFAYTGICTDLILITLMIYNVQSDPEAYRKNPWMHIPACLHSYFQFSHYFWLNIICYDIYMSIK